jgi:hypothetical protein
MSPTRPTIPELLLEQYVLDELTAERRQAVEDARVADPSVQQRLDAIRASNGAVLKAMPPRVFAAAVDERARVTPNPSSNRRLWSLAVPVLLAAVAVFVAVPVAISTLEDGPNGVRPVDVVRAKGDPMVFVHRQQGRGEPEKLGEGDEVSEGDVLQVSYTAAGAEFGAIFSVDGRGTVTWHLPSNGHRATRLQEGAGVPLDHAYEIDDAPRFERFVLVTGPDDFDLGPVEDAAREWGGIGEIQLDVPLRATLLSLRKEAR